MPKHKKSEKGSDPLRLVKSHTSVDSGDFAPSSPSPEVIGTAPSWNLPLANRHPNPISHEEAETARLWRNLMQLQLPMDHELWETDKVKPDADKLEDYTDLLNNMGNIFGNILTRKPAVMAANELVRVDSTHLVESDDNHPPGSVSPPRKTLSAEQIIGNKKGGRKSEPKVFKPNPKVKSNVSGVPPDEDEEKTPLKAVFTNQDLKRHVAWYSKCFRCLFCRNHVYPAALEVQVNGPRTTNSVAYINAYVEALQLKRAPPGRAEARNNLIDSYKRSTEALFRLKRVKDIVENATKTLGFAHYYLERNLTANEVKLTQKRTIIGCLIWMSTFAVQYINNKNVDAQVKHDVKLRIEDVVGSSILLFSAIVHVEETVRSCMSILENAIQKYIFTLKPTDDERRGSSNPHAEVHPDKVDRLRRRWAKIEHQIALKKAAEDLYYFTGKSTKVPRPGLKFFSRVNKMGNAWVALKTTKTKEALGIILRSTTKLLAIIEDELTQLTNVDRATQAVVPALDTIKKPKNFLEAVVLLERNFRCFHEFPNNLLKNEEVVDLKELGRILLDHIDEMNTSIEALSWIGLESSQIVQICYEYIRVYYKWPLPEYDGFASESHRRYMALWAHGPDFNAVRPLRPIREPIAMFHSSVYQTILRTVALNIGDRDIILGEQDERQPKAYVAEGEKSRAELEHRIAALTL